MSLRRLLFTAFVITLIVLIVSNGFTTSIAETFKDYMLNVSAGKVKPNDKVQITVCSVKPGETLLMVITDEKGDLINTSVLAVYKGAVAQAGRLIIVKTDMVDASAVFCIKAPSRPGIYTIKLYDPIDVKAEKQILVEWTIQQLLERPEMIVAGLFILAAVLAATVYLFVLMPA